MERYHIVPLFISRPYLLIGQLYTIEQFLRLDEMHICVWWPNMTEIRTLLLIDDDSHHSDVFIDALPNAIDGPYKGEWVTTLTEGIERLKKREIWAAFVNLSLPDSHTWTYRCTQT
jgi:hypothetical protein